MKKRSFIFLATLVSVIVVLQGVSSAAVKPGKYKGTTNERGTVSFTVSAGGKSVISFSTTDGYNSGCHFSGGAGGIPTLTVVVRSMTVTKAGTFTATTKVAVPRYSETATIVVKGKLAGSHASGTVNWPSETCGSNASNSGAAMYLESFTAARG